MGEEGTTNLLSVHQHPRSKTVVITGANEHLLLACVGTEKKVKVELEDVRHYIEAGVSEAQACGDVEMQAEFMVERVNLNLIEGRPVPETKALLSVSAWDDR